MASGSSRRTNTPNFVIQNSSIKLKREIVSIAASEGKTYSQFIREQIIKVRNSYPDSARKYLESDDCN